MQLRRAIEEYHRKQAWLAEVLSKAQFLMPQPDAEALLPAHNAAALLVSHDGHLPRLG